MNTNNDNIIQITINLNYKLHLMIVHPIKIIY